MPKIALASDHAGFDLKNAIILFLKNENYEIVDFGCFSQESTDYADFAHPMAYAVENDSDMIGIACCGSGNGINMTVNKHPGIRSALCWNIDTAVLARAHNNANICSLPARFVSESLAIDIVKNFLNTNFDFGRHLQRINKIPL